MASQPSAVNMMPKIQSHVGDYFLEILESHQRSGTKHYL